MSSLPSPEAQPLREQTYEALQRLLLSGAYRAGAALTEAKLAERLGVSRTPVREALMRLEDDGLIEANPSGKRIVADLGAKVSEVLQVRLQLEPFAVGLAAHRMTGNDLDELWAIQNRIEELLPDWNQNCEEILELNRRFHRQIVGHCGNRCLIDVLDRLSPFSVFPRILTHYSEEQRATAFAEHPAILDALWKRDRVAAEAAARAHLERGAAIIKAAVG